ncbi:uncharacterized protein MONOS_14661 [Monocercomonoides exilis]|uniref:uncharacterized protein n=1 Tax=Monocercomonoides exilis TaxID=2049356 RepID=UPI00355AC6F2|nr:hypothetical protein MONOS_14661 [Monocercomonoides exilis]|eukprot:MONOS_14661.1-p1 / transcript=MONOS_14661.1 / gene=MONOS_14661 / organism=Monocercomonoides_exilis_PA203 / gene_product=unspecified product / transcript_product=unspecified product / location=Mono_scaffold01043:19172-19520(-) / protein_length=67 / sequence_SO=supercontig / SO=protein_coding / is_pseudo=false
MIVIDFSDASAVAALFTSAAEMDNVEWRLRIIVSEAAGVSVVSASSFANSVGEHYDVEQARGGEVG